ncbi:MAG: MOSC N-terminal beta barrel domain-containing protein [Bacteroidota bacterium]
MKLTGIYCYPIKSLGGISLKEATITERGIKYDRRWMLIDANGQFISQRTFSELALFSVSIEDSFLLIQHRSSSIESLKILLDAVTGPTMEVQIWDDTVDAILCSATADAWFSHILQRTVHLVYMPDASTRQIDLKYAPKGYNVSFADGYPLLIIGESTLADLNSRLETPVSMNRFRPNLVFEGGTTGYEDTFDLVKIGEATLKGTKPCARCQVITIDQDSGESSKEPLRTLSTYRKEGNKVLFGMNMYPVEKGKVALGDFLTTSHS